MFPLYLRSDAEEKARILRLIASNYVLNGQTISAAYVKPFSFMKNLGGRIIKRDLQDVIRTFGGVDRVSQKSCLNNSFDIGIENKPLSIPSISTDLRVMSLLSCPNNRKHQTLTCSNSNYLREAQCLVFSLIICYFG